MTLQKTPQMEALQPERIHEHALSWVSHFCEQIELHIVDHKAGITEEEIGFLQQTLDDYQKLLDVQRGKIKLSEKRLAQIRERIPESETMPEETCAGTVRLLQALVSLARYMAKIDELHKADKPSQEKETVILGAAANIKFLNFFLAMQKEYGLDIRELTELYTQVFYQSSIAHELQLIDFQNFPPGILAAVRAYWYLKQSSYQNADFHVPTPEEDMYHGVDLVCEKKDDQGAITEQSLFQVKGRNKGGNATVFDVSDGQQLAELRKTLEEQKLPDWDLEHHLQVLQKLIKYRDELQKGKAYPVKAYWVEVLMEY